MQPMKTKGDVISTPKRRKPKGGKMVKELSDEEAKTAGDMLRYLMVISGEKKVVAALFSKKRVITVARSHKLDRRASQISFVVTVGKPNYRTREQLRKVNDFPWFRYENETR